VSLFTLPPLVALVLVSATVSASFSEQPLNGLLDSIARCP
jgi:hypothetical protein